MLKSITNKIGTVLRGVPIIINLLKKITATEWFFYAFELLIIGIMVFFVVISKSKENLSWTGLLFTIGYVFLIRRKVRPILKVKWNYFSRKLSAPYTLTFIGLFLLCILLTILKIEPIAEQLANVAYLMLVVSVGVEIITMKKNSSQEDEVEDGSV